MIEILELLLNHFDNDEGKVALWLDTKNPMLGNQRPMDMFMIGRTEKLMDFVSESIGDNNV